MNIEETLVWAISVGAQRIQPSLTSGDVGDLYIDRRGLVYPVPPEHRWFFERAAD
jgi:hypothetical protein